MCEGCAAKWTILSLQIDSYRPRRRLCPGIRGARFAQARRFWGSLAFRLTAWYVLAGLALVVLTSASLYFLLVTELKKSADLFLAEK